MLHKYLTNKHLILASQSPRRKELLAGLDIKFDIFVIPDIDESIPQGFSGSVAAEYLAGKKADAYTKVLKSDTVIITADTIVCVDNQILNKPESIEDANRMLGLLSGKTHEVITGVCLLADNQKIIFSETTKVKFSVLSEDIISYYTNTYRPFDKAGAYGIQEWIGYVGIEHIEGSYYNVMGLPVQKLYVKLCEFFEISI